MNIKAFGANKPASKSRRAQGILSLYRSCLSTRDHVQVWNPPYRTLEFLPRTRRQEPISEQKWPKVVQIVVQIVVLLGPELVILRCPGAGGVQEQEVPRSRRSTRARYYLSYPALVYTLPYPAGTTPPWVHPVHTLPYMLSAVGTRWPRVAGGQPGLRQASLGWVTSS